MRWSATIDQFSYNVLKITPPNGGYTVYIQRPEQESNRDTKAQIWRVSIYILDVRIECYWVSHNEDKLIKPLNSL